MCLKVVKLPDQQLMSLNIAPTGPNTAPCPLQTVYRAPLTPSAAPRWSYSHPVSGYCMATSGVVCRFYCLEWKGRRVLVVVGEGFSNASPGAPLTSVERCSRSTRPPPHKHILYAYLQAALSEGYEAVQTKSPCVTVLLSLGIKIPAN